MPKAYSDKEPTVQSDKLKALQEALERISKNVVMYYCGGCGWLGTEKEAEIHEGVGEYPHETECALCPTCGKEVDDIDAQEYAEKLLEALTRPVPAPKLDEDEDSYRLLACRIAQAADAHLFGVPDQHTGEALNNACRALREKIAKEAALASPKADPKTEGERLSDESIDRIAAAWQTLELIQGMKPEWFLPLCAQAKRCNALERELEVSEKRTAFQSAAADEFTRLLKNAEAERDALRLNLDQAIMERIDANHDKGHALAREAALRQTVEEMQQVVEAAKSLAAWEPNAANEWSRAHALDVLRQALAKGQPAPQVYEQKADPLLEGLRYGRAKPKPADGKE